MKLKNLFTRAASCAVACAMAAAILLTGCESVGTGSTGGTGSNTSGSGTSTTVPKVDNTGSDTDTDTDTDTGTDTDSTTALTASALRSAQISAINSARGSNGKNTLTVNSQLNTIAANIADKAVTGGTTLTDYLSYVFDTYDNQLEINGKTVELHVSLEKFSLGVTTYTCSTSDQKATWDASYIGNAVVETDDAFYVVAVFATPVQEVIWTGETNDDGTITLTGYDDSGDVPTGDITLPSTLGGKEVTELSQNFLAGCDTITSIIVPGSVQVIWHYAFQNCANLKSVTIQEGLEIMGGHVFDGCTSLVEVNLPDSLKTFGKDYWYMYSCVFSGCTSLEQFNYPSNSSITLINTSMFSGCTSLKKIYIPKNITTINSSAFYGCTALTDVYYAGSQAEWAEVTINSGNSYLLNATMHYYSTAF